jgi:hypothetical protein
MPDSAPFRVVAYADDHGYRVDVADEVDFATEPQHAGAMTQVASGNRHGAIAAELGALAIREVAELGPVPFDQRERDLWREERRGAVELLAILAAWDAALLRRAAVEVASEWTDRGARDLLLDAALSHAATRSSPLSTVPR